MRVRAVLAALLVVFGLAGAACGSSVPIPSLSPPFARTGSLTADRAGHTATLLQDGRVLIAGGWGDHGALASAELYDPRAGRFSQTGSMRTARWHHTATLLPDGRVLIAGGGDASAERYDPRTGTFSPTGSMSVPRGYHSATLMLDGRVLIAGGEYSYQTQETSGIVAVHGSTYASAELYDPQAGTFSPTGSMAAIRESHTATLLKDGRVLIAGGRSGLTAQVSAELYDPRIGTFSPAAFEAVCWGEYTSTLLQDGRVLLLSVYGSGLYDPSTDTYSGTDIELGSGEETMHTATLLQDGRVLAVGWFNGAAELYDTSTGTFSSAGSWPMGWTEFTATLLHDGRVLIAGGYGACWRECPVSSAALYQP